MGSFVPRQGESGSGHSTSRLVGPGDRILSFLMFSGMEKYAGNDRYQKLYCYESSQIEVDLNLADYSEKYG